MRNTLLVVDDMEMNRDILELIFSDSYKIIKAEDGLQAIAMLEKYKDEICAVLLDIFMPNMDGFGVLDFMHKNNMDSSIPTVLITGDTSNEVKKKGYSMGVSDVIEKPFDSQIVKTRIDNIVELYLHKNSLEDLVDEQTKKIMLQAEKINQTNRNLWDTLGAIVEFRNHESGMHIYRVREFTRVLLASVAENYPEYGLTDELIDAMAFASVMHDVGKISVSDTILLKPGRLTDEEFEIMKTHTTKGSEIIDAVCDTDEEIYFKYGRQIARSHHERYDGRGYPDGLTGDEIPLCAQIVSIADVYDALVSERVYKPPFTPSEAFRMITNGECGQFNPKLLDCFKIARKQFEELADRLK